LSAGLNSNQGVANALAIDTERLCLLVQKFQEIDPLLGAGLGGIREGMAVRENRVESASATDDW